MELFPYATVIFDCDGVLLNSNSVKSKAFYEVALPYGKTCAKELLRFHKKNGGISRNKKFDYFVNNIVSQENDRIDVRELLRLYSKLSYEGLLDCEICEGLYTLRRNTLDIPWLVVSGGNENEVQKVLKQKGIYDYFDNGIFGSPKSKEQIFKGLIERGIIKFPAVFLGDSRYDYEVASEFGVDFIFIYGWTEFEEWEKFCGDNMVRATKNVGDLNYFFDN